MKNQFILIRLFAVIAAMMCAHCASAYDFVVNGIYYNQLTSNTVEVTYKVKNQKTYSGWVEIPERVSNGGTTYTVTAIGDNAFTLCSGLTRVTIPNTVTTIGYEAFQTCTQLTVIDIPNSVTSIDHYAFYQCINLSSVTLGSGLTSIGYYAFISCSALRYIYCYAIQPPSVDYSFENYSNITIYVPSPKYYENTSPWSSFKSIKEVIGGIEYDVLENGVHYLITGSNTVSMVYVKLDENVLEYTVPSSVTSNGVTYTVTAVGYGDYEACIDGPYGLRIIIPNTVQIINDNAFNYLCSDVLINDVVIPNSVTSIGKNAFTGCYFLRSVTIPSSVTSIGSYAFSGGYCSTDLNEGMQVTCLSFRPPQSGGSIFVQGGQEEKDGTRSYPDIVEYITYNHGTLTVPGPYSVQLYRAAYDWKDFANIVAANPYDFYDDGLYYLITGDNTCKVTYRDANYNSYSGSKTIPSTVTYAGTIYRVTGIGENAFRNCTGLTGVYIGRNVTEIEYRAFYGCSSLTSVNIPASVTSIGNGAFSYTSLTNVSIPNSVTTIGVNAFGDISTLTSVIIGSGCTSLYTYAFDSPLTKVTCLATTPPSMINTNCFGTPTYNNATLFVPAASVSAYRTATGWKNFANIQGLPTLDNALNVSGGDIHFTSTGDYPWMVIVDDGRNYAQSSNAGNHSSVSTLKANVTLSNASTLTFDFKAWGEGTYYDRCIFYIDGTEMFYYGSLQNNWETYTTDLAAGSHTLTWTYNKDASVNPMGDYFAIDNVAITVVATRGDVNGDGNVSITDVTALIDYLLTPGSTPPAGGDVNLDTNITIVDVTALIDYLLSGTWPN